MCWTFAPSCKAEAGCDSRSYRHLSSGTITPEEAASLLPDRATLAAVWRYLASVPAPQIQEAPICLCRKIVRWSGLPLQLGQLLVCLDIFADVGLLQLTRLTKHLQIRLITPNQKADLTSSATMQRLMNVKESIAYGNL